MLILFSIFVALTAFLHLMFFKLESIDFMQERILKRFGLTHEQGAIVRIWALNQGFYNLFLALGLIYSLYLVHGDQMRSGLHLAQFILLMITGAGVVLLISAPKKYPAALLQALPALLGFILSLLV